MKLFAGLGALFFALAISGVAATFSVTGLAALFAAAFWSVVIMGSTLEGAKLVAAAWLHANWHNKRVGILHKAYLTLAVLALMVITAIGIYGFLSKGYLEQQAPVGAITIEIEQREAALQAKQADVQQLRARQSQLDAAVNSLITQQHVGASQKLRLAQQGERAEVEQRLSADETVMERLAAELVPLKLQTSDVSAKLGPVRYVAELFGWKDTDSAVRMIILTLMFAFDPLAVVLILSSAISIGEWQDERRLRASRQELPAEPAPLVVEIAQAAPVADLTQAGEAFPPLPATSRRPPTRPVSHRRPLAPYRGRGHGVAPTTPPEAIPDAPTAMMTEPAEEAPAAAVLPDMDVPASEDRSETSEAEAQLTPNSPPGSFQRFGSKGWLDE